MTNEEIIEDIKRLCKKSSFQSKDLILVKMYYGKYIGNAAAMCLSCPSSARHYIKGFQRNLDKMIKKIENGDS